MHAKKLFIDDMQAAFRQEPVNVRYATVGGILYRQHGQISLTIAHGLDHRLESSACQWLQMWSRAARRFMAIRAKFALKGYASRHRNSCAHASTRAFGRASYPLKVPSGSG